MVDFRQQPSKPRVLPLEPPPSVLQRVFRVFFPMIPRSDAVADAGCTNSPPPSFTYVLIGRKSADGIYQELTEAADRWRFTWDGAHGSATYQNTAGPVANSPLQYYNTCPGEGDQKTYYYFTEVCPDGRRRMWLFQDRPLLEENGCMIFYYYEDLIKQEAGVAQKT
jgi:hypothetical protein